MNRFDKEIKFALLSTAFVAFVFVFSIQFSVTPAVNSVSMNTLTDGGTVAEFDVSSILISQVEANKHGGTRCGAHRSQNCNCESNPCVSYQGTRCLSNCLAGNGRRYSCTWERRSIRADGTGCGGGRELRCSGPWKAKRCYWYNKPHWGVCQSGTCVTPISCNNDGICNGQENSNWCPAECSASCSNNGVCEANEALTCSDCAGVCDKDGVCEAGEGGGVCPSDCPFEFSTSIDPSEGIANKGDTKDINVTITLTSGTPESVDLSASSLPSGTTASFTPVSCTPECYSNGTLTTTASTPEGVHSISIDGTNDGNTESATYDLTVLSDDVSATCGAVSPTCDYPETQSTCPSDCETTANIPSPVSPGDVVTVTVEFYDSRYQEDGKVKIDMVVNPEGTIWDSNNGCFFGGVKMGSVASGNTIAWPPGTTSEDGHFRISTTCTLPSSISAGSHTLVATPTIF